MTTNASRKSAESNGAEARMLLRIIDEGYGKGAWHGPDLKAAIADVTPEIAFRPPSPGRHSIAEIVIHHAYYVHSVRGQLTGIAPEPFILEGNDWFALTDQGSPGWPEIRAAVETEQNRLREVVADIAAGRTASALPDTKRLELVVGITCHAVYHAGQIQLIKRFCEK